MKFPEMLTGVQHIGVPTNDLEKTVAFYETIGFQPVLEIVNEAANERVTFLQLKNLVIETYENHAAVGKPGAIARHKFVLYRDFIKRVKHAAEVFRLIVIRVIDNI